MNIKSDKRRISIMDRMKLSAIAPVILSWFPSFGFLVISSLSRRDGDYAAETIQSSVGAINPLGALPRRLSLSVPV